LYSNSCKWAAPQRGLSGGRSLRSPPPRPHPIWPPVAGNVPWNWSSHLKQFESAHMLGPGQLGCVFSAQALQINYSRGSDRFQRLFDFARGPGVWSADLLLISISFCWALISAYVWRETAGLCLYWCCCGLELLITRATCRKAKETKGSPLARLAFVCGRFKLREMCVSYFPSRERQGRQKWRKRASASSDPKSSRFLLMFRWLWFILSSVLLVKVLTSNAFNVDAPIKRVW